MCKLRGQIRFSDQTRRWDQKKREINDQKTVSVWCDN